MHGSCSSFLVEVSREDLLAVQESARAHGFDRYLAALLAPAGERQDLVALAAFAGEIERVPLIVSEAALGEIRLRWWLDWIDGLDGAGRTGNPIADVLQNVIVRRGLSRDLLRGIVDARAQLLYGQPFQDGKAFEVFTEATEGALFALATEVVETTTGEAGRSAEASAYGKVYGSARLLLQLPFFVAQGRWPLPSGPEGLNAQGLGEREVRERADVLRSETICQTRASLEEARHSFGRLSGAVRAGGLPAALVEPYLRALERQGDWLCACADISPLARVWKLWRASRTGRV
jgi:15-cis-phytoene synthase